MKKTQKNRDKHWTTGYRLAILCASCLNWCVFAESPPALTAGQKGESSSVSARIENANGGRKEYVELDEALRQLEQLRLSYAELVLENQALVDEMAHLRLQVANLLGEHRTLSAEQHQAEILAGMLEMRRQHENLYRQVHEFGDFLQTILTVLQPSRILGQEIERRYAELSQSVARVEHLPSIVAWRGGDPVRPRNEARILRVDERLQLVVLDAGSVNQVRPGSRWQVKDGSDSSIARIKVVAIRSGISAAIPIDGSLPRIMPGMRAEMIQAGQ